MEIKIRKAVLSYLGSLIRFVLIFTVFFRPLYISAQEKEYGLENPGPAAPKKCIELYTFFNSKPADVTFGFQVKDQDIYFGITDARYLNLLFTSKNDGIGIDIMTKDQFPCGSENNFTNSEIHKGILLPPSYFKDFRKNITVTEKGGAIVKVGVLPKDVLNKEYELNMLLIKDKNVCNYSGFYDLPRERWELLKMGLYTDSMPDGKGSGRDSIAREQLQQKQMTFVIPFEKNKFEYSPSDIKPIYDSLRLTDYIITKINVKAYASVEGPKRNNIMLQNKRAESIIKALQSYQNPRIETTINASENWVEFLNDITGTPFESLSFLIQSEVKKKLEDKNLSNEIEPILRKHRKAILVLDLQKKTIYHEADTNKLKIDFKKHLASGNLLKAKEIQEEAYSRIKGNQLPETFIQSMEVPNKTEFATLLTSKAAFEYERHPEDVKRTLQAFLKLSDLLPEDIRIKYNVVVLKLQTWKLDERAFDPEVLKREIKILEGKGIHPFLIKRLMINYHILLSEFLIEKKNYASKDQSVKYIYDNFKSLKLGDEDLLQVSQYFSSYSKFDWAEKILLPRVRSIQVNEDLLFFYLNLTIIKPENTKRSTYRTILLNAYNLNKERFCKMFNPYGKGGINFQLLDDPNLKKNYCESCN